MASATPPDVTRASVGRGALWSLASVGAGQGVSLLTFLVTARFVSKESFGVMAVSLALVELLKRVGVEPFSLAVNTRPEVAREDYDACFWLTLASTLAMVTAVLAGSFLVSGLGGDPHLVDALRLVAALLLTVGLWFTHEAWLTRHMEFRVLALRSILASLLGGAVGVAMAVRGYDIWSLVGQQLVTGATSLLLLWTTSSWRPRLSVPRAALFANLGAARHLALSAMGTFFSTETDIFVASTMLGVETAGLYNAAKRIMLAMHLFLTNSIQNVTLSAFANIADRERRSGASLRAITVVAAITIPAACGLIVMSGQLVRVLLGEHWLAAAPILSALAIGVATTSLMQFNVTLFLVNGSLPAVTRYAMLSSLLNVAVLPVAALFGSTALAVGVAGVQLAIFPLSTRHALKVGGIAAAAYAERIARPALASAAMAALLVLLQRSSSLVGVTALAVDVPIGAAAYAAALSVLSPSAVLELLGLAGSILRGRRATPAVPLRHSPRT